MRVVCTTLALAGVVSLCPREAAGQSTLTLAEALARAREQAPRIVSARLALDEARGRLLGAAVRLPSNPELDVSLGSRRGDGDRWMDFEVGAAQMFEPPGRRAARMAGARAEVDQATASVDDTTRGVLRETAAWFHRAAYASERIRLLTASEAVAMSILEAAHRRYRAGDIPILDVNLARASLARARLAREGGQADLRGRGRRAPRPPSSRWHAGGDTGACARRARRRRGPVASRRPAPRASRAGSGDPGDRCGSRSRADRSRGPTTA